MTSVSTSNHRGSVSTSRPSMSNSTASRALIRPPRWRSAPAFADALYLLIRSPARSYAEVFRLGVVHHHGVRGLLRGELELLGQLHADPAGVEQPDDLGPVLQVRAGGVAEGEPGAAITQLEEVLQVGRDVPADVQLGPDPGVPELGQRLGELDREPVQLDVVAVGVLLE